MVKYSSSAVDVTTCLGKVLIELKMYSTSTEGRGGSRAAATSKRERFVIIVNGF